MKCWFTKLLAASMLLFGYTAFAADPAGFPAYVEQLKVEAREQGFSADTIERAFADASFYERAVSADRNQPEFKLTLDTYLPRAVPDWKVRPQQHPFGPSDSHPL